MTQTINSALKTHIETALLKSRAASELLDKADATEFGKMGKLLDDLSVLVGIARNQAEAALSLTLEGCDGQHPRT